MRFPPSLRRFFPWIFARLAIQAQGTVTVQLSDYAAVPQSGALVNTPDNAVYVARVNFLREEPGGGLGRLFVCSHFRDRFEDKGCYTEYLSAIPTYIIHAALPALVGLAHAFNEPGPRWEAE